MAGQFLLPILCRSNFSYDMDGNDFILQSEDVLQGTSQVFICLVNLLCPNVAFKYLICCLQVILQQHQRNIQSCAQSIASLAKEMGCALSSQWDIPGGHPQEWVEGGFFLSFWFILLLFPRSLESPSLTCYQFSEASGWTRTLSTRPKITGLSVAGK